jgi:hypothetical protein
MALPETRDPRQGGPAVRPSGALRGFAGVAELVDALDLGSSGASRGGSSPSARTISLLHHTPPSANAGGDVASLPLLAFHPTFPDAPDWTKGLLGRRAGPCLRHARQKAAIV